MCLKPSFSHSKWVLHSILSLTVLSKCVSGSSNFDTAFLPDCTKFCSVFLGCWIGNLMRIPKMCLKLSFFYSKWDLQSILSLTVLSNCVSGSSNIDTVFLPDCTTFWSVFLDNRIGNLTRIPKMCLKLSFFHSKWVLQAILSLTVFSNCVSGSSKFDTAFLPNCTRLDNVFLGYWIGNLMGILKMCLKLSSSYSKWVLPAILSLTVFSNCVSGSSKFDTVFLPDCTKFCNVFF